jgi:hypothetical protein
MYLTTTFKSLRAAFVGLGFCVTRSVAEAPAACDALAVDLRDRI